jgi:hypothetical protein
MTGAALQVLLSAPAPERKKIRRKPAAPEEPGRTPLFAGHAVWLAMP